MTAPDRTPADELRAAAKTLLETAAPALEGTEPPVLLADGEWDEWAVYYSRRIDELLPGDGPWITLMTPLLAEDFAALLNAVAEFVTRHPDLGREHVDGEPCDDYACGIVTRVRRLARIINSAVRDA